MESGNGAQGYRVEKARPDRLMVRAFVRLHDTSSVYAFSQLDVTEAERRAKIATRHLRCGVSLTGYLIYCLAQSVKQHPQMNSALVGRKMLYFDDVDVVATAEHGTGAARHVRMRRLRAAQNLSLAETLVKLRALNKGPMQDAQSEKFRNLLGRHTWLAALMLRLFGRNPVWLKRNYGTVGVTILQTPGFSLPFYVLAQTIFCSGITLGPITDELKVTASGGTEKRRILHATFAAKHDIADGADMLRGTRTFVNFVESATGLDDAFVEEFAKLNALPGYTPAASSIFDRDI